MPMIAALSTSHLAALKLPNGLRRLYVARDEGEPGQEAGRRLAERAQEAEIGALMLSPRVDDFNMDLRTFGPEALAASIRPQLAPEDAERFLSLSDVCG
jgi:hypothetical protein